jgi:dipeptidyl aminopeptidase/acylaminoacyl peptidase
VLPSTWTRAGAAGGQASTSQVESNASITRPDFDRMLRRQAATNRTWEGASAGFMRMERISYPSRADNLDVPAFVFRPLTPAGGSKRPALIWVHENIRGHLYEHYIPYVREATRRGYVVLAPEYRGSVGYGQSLYDAIDYGGAEVDDVVTAVAVLAERYPEVDTSRVGVIGWSHGGMIALLGTLRYPGTFGAAVAIAPVTNLFHRLAAKGVDSQLRVIDPHGRFGGLPSQRPDVYRDRSPLFQVDRLQDPLLVHMADNDEDVTIEEGTQLIDALTARKPALAETRIYRNPRGGHMFDRQVDSLTFQPEGTSDQLDSWQRVWAFLGRYLGE